MVNDKGRKHLPPYVSYRTFRSFIDGLQQRIPARIDRSYWGDLLSGSTGTQLMAALRFLDLIDNLGRPTARLKPLVSANNEQRSEVLKETMSGAYGFVLQGSFDPQSATYAQLQEAFHNEFQLTADVSRKCIKFFIGLAADAGMPLSPFITKRFRSAHTGTGTKASTRKPTHRVSRNGIAPQNLAEIPPRMPWDTMLLNKFPTFDPSWNDEVKLKWLDAFDQLLKLGLNKNEKLN